MKYSRKMLACLGLICALTTAQIPAQTAAPATTTPHHKKAHRAKVAAGPSIQSQIDSLRTDLQGEIQALKQQLSERDAQLQQAQQTAQAAQAAAQQAQQAAQADQQASTDNTAAVSSLQGAVTDLKSNNTLLVSSMQSDQAQLQKSIETPEVLHFKGVTLSPTGSFLAAETVWRQKAVGGDINTPFTSIPLDHSDAAHLSEFYGTGRQSRVALLAEGKLANSTMRGFYEADWLSAGVTSNNNQSNSYTMRQRQLWAQAEFGHGWTVTGGQMWSLATETKVGMNNRSENLPMTIDAQYTAGFVWARQYGFRVVKKFGNTLWAGVSAENAETLNIGGTTPANILIGGPGTGGGLYNLNANYSFNIAPDFVAKVVLEPRFGGHYEVFAIGRFFRDRIYPNGTGTAASSVGAFNDSTTGGGLGGSLRVPTFRKRLDVGVKGLWGQGIGRYGSSTLADSTLNPSGQLALLHGFSALGTLELHATPKLDIYANYGGDYVGRRAYATSATTGEGYGSPLFVNTGCGTEPVPGGSFLPNTPSKCAANNRDVQEFTMGYWFDFYKGPKGRLRQGLQYADFNRQTWSGVGGAPKAQDNMFWTSFRYYLP
ncbi:MAG TPA: hypothetical protein VGD59_14815 [Acidisarcina sp.]